MSHYQDGLVNRIRLQRMTRRRRVQNNLLSLALAEYINYVPTANEMRARYGMPPIDGGNIHD